MPEAGSRFRTPLCKCGHLHVAHGVVGCLGWTETDCTATVCPCTGYIPAIYLFPALPTAEELYEVLRRQDP